MQIQAIKVQRLYLQVAQQLQDLIGVGTFVAGSRLPSERDLATQFGVSRPTIREAMIALEIKGLVDVRSGSGVYVNSPENRALTLPADMKPSPTQILEARKLIEGEICALCAAQISDQQLVQLEQLVGKGSGAWSVGQSPELFYGLLAEIAGNCLLSTTLNWLREQNAESGVIEDHLAIVEALGARDPEASRAASNRVLQKMIDQLGAVQ